MPRFVEMPEDCSQLRDCAIIQLSFRLVVGLIVHSSSPVFDKHRKFRLSIDVSLGFLLMEILLVFPAPDKGARCVSIQIKDSIYPYQRFRRWIWPTNGKRGAIYILR